MDYELIAIVENPQNWDGTIIEAAKREISSRGGLINLKEGVEDDEVWEKELEKPKSGQNSLYIKLGVALLIILVFTLPFHYVIIPSNPSIFPKENLSLSNTIIFQSDIDDLIEKYNKAGFVVQMSINQESIYKKLFEKGYIIENNERPKDNYKSFSTADSSGFAVVNIKRDTLLKQGSESFSDEGKPVIVFHLKASILNKTDKIITEAKVTGKIRLVFPETATAENERYASSGFNSYISKSDPWMPNEVREFNIQTNDIPVVYLNYKPAEATFELNLEAKDPMGYEFNNLIREEDLLNQWYKLPVRK